MSDYPEKYRHDLEVIRNTGEQLKKDFATFGMDISVSGSEQTAYEELKSQVILFVIDLLQNKRDSFLSLLYRIDVSEKKVREALNRDSKNEQAEALAHLIIEREFLKVLTRKLFSGSGG